MSHRTPTVARGLLALAAVAAAAALCGCAAPTATLAERVDERTAVNVVTLGRAMLYTASPTATTAKLDLSYGPVELNRQGQKSWYLWVSVLGVDTDRPGAAITRFRLLADGAPLVTPVPVPADGLPISTRPYTRVAEWATEGWFALTAEELASLYGRGDLVPEVALGDGQWVRFEAWDVDTGALDAYISAQLSGRVAGR